MIAAGLVRSAAAADGTVCKNFIGGSNAADFPAAGADGTHFALISA